ncbi:RNA polymerase sigma-70 factor (ECF subfamily) [Caldicoprobacter guelmensis]|uniref:RNA polymerase sigma factor n=1 Tax=Caldicoprobacter guelmensis TaxID=1170224 RepID=UPI00195841B0|nr:sigma-70 family RNA polymerase sigma factor [Caldicoprobacter guelmensis]MBM7582584.1 RNA polymerase sigma-70 factor (ECF subfamily) [Caldicoprobacter guelmensis]
MGDEALLVEKAKKGDMVAFEELVSLYAKKIYNYCYRMTNNKEDAEDLAQEVFIKVYKNLKSFKGNSKISTWIYRIAYNTCIDKYKKGSKVDTVSLNPGKDEDAVGIELVSGDPLPEEEVIKKERYRKLQACIAALKPEYKTVIILRDIQNYSYEEIAEILQVPLGTVKSHISRARAALSDALREMLE